MVNQTEERKLEEGILVQTDHQEEIEEDIIQAIQDQDHIHHQIVEEDQAIIKKSDLIQEKEYLDQLLIEAIDPLQTDLENLVPVHDHEIDTLGKGTRGIVGIEENLIDPPLNLDLDVDHHIIYQVQTINLMKFSCFLP